MISFTLESDRIQREVNEITKDLYSFEVQKVYLAEARVMAAGVRRNAPKQSGRLRKAVKTQGAKPQTVATRGPSAAVIVNLKRGAVRAPHGHLVEGGTRFMPAQHFFARAINDSGERALAKVAAETAKIIERGLGR